MIRTNESLAVQLRLLGHAERALASLRGRVLAKNPRNYAIFSEAYVDQIEVLRAEIDEYLAKRPVAEKTDDVEVAAAEGEYALNAGNTQRARERYEAAGECLEARIKNAWKQSEKHRLRFLAANEYYRGGNYARANSLCQKTQADLLPRGIRPLFETLSRNAKNRSRSDYRAEVQRRLVQLLKADDYQEILDTLKDHPYALSARNLAVVRQECCEKLKDFRAAAAFAADSVRMNPLLDSAYWGPTSAILQLLADDGVSEAEAYAEHLMKYVPHAMAFVGASLVRYFQAQMTASDSARRDLTEEELRLMCDAHARFSSIPAALRGSEGMRRNMQLGFTLAVFGALRNLNKDQAFAIANLAVTFDPTAPRYHTLRGIVRYPAPESVGDFAEAARLNDTIPHPYYFLAGAALRLGEFQNAISWSKRVLALSPDARMQAHMLVTLAIAHHRLGTAQGEVQDLIAQADRLDPGLPWFDQQMMTMTPEYQPKKMIDDLILSMPKDLPSKTVSNSQSILQSIAA